MKRPSIRISRPTKKQREQWRKQKQQHSMTCMPSWKKKRATESNKNCKTEEQGKNEDIQRKILVGKFHDKLRETKLRWLGHVMRRNEEYVGRRRMSKWETGRRTRGRPKRRWEDCVREDLKVIGKTEEDAIDRAEWRRAIYTGDLLLHSTAVMLPGGVFRPT